jgi:hypothetical protein
MRKESGREMTTAPGVERWKSRISAKVFGGSGVECQAAAARWRGEGVMDTY